MQGFAIKAKKNPFQRAKEAEEAKKKARSSCCPAEGDVPACMEGRAGQGSYATQALLPGRVGGVQPGRRSAQARER